MHILTVDACKYIIEIVMDIIIGHSKEEILSYRYDSIQRYVDEHE